MSVDTELTPKIRKVDSYNLDLQKNYAIFYEEHAEISIIFPFKIEDL